jgi:signal transduction histidine kinase
MFLGGFSGATAFFPDKVVGTSYIPPIVITDFRLSGNQVDIGDRSPLQKSISFSRDLSLSHNQNIFSLTFSALSFANPGTNRYRYKLEPLEPDWNEVRSDRRQATYTTLPAGTYRFRAQSAISGGLWSEPGVSLNINVRPAWWATWWFRAFYLTAALLLFLSVYRYRIHQIDRQFTLRLEERTSLARRFHDTLLQTIHASAMIVSVARESPDDPETVVSALDKLSLQSLRNSTEQTNDLATALREFGDVCAIAQFMRFSLSTEGAAGKMHPIVQDEILQIGREAIRNACKHSQGNKVEVAIRYSRRLTMRISDDGRGIEPDTLANGREGHFGLKGMHERAGRIGGKLTVVSTPGSGTEINLTVPGHRIFRQPGLLARMFRDRRSQTGQQVR